MRLDFTTLAVGVALVVAFVALWSNPRRPINQVFFSLSLHVALWLMTMGQAFVSENGLYWVRVTASLGTLIQLHLWIVKETVLYGNQPLAVKLSRGWRWALATFALSIIPFTSWFIPEASTATVPLVGFGYYVHIFGLVSFYAALGRQTLVQMRTQTGTSRLELQILLLGSIAVAFAVISLGVLRVAVGVSTVFRLQPLVVLAFYAATVAAMTTHRVLDARQIVVICAEKTLLVVATAGVVFVSDFALSPLVPKAVDILVTTAFALWFAAGFGRWLDQRFHFYAEASRTRQAAFAVAGKEAQVPKLREAFLPILKGWGQSERVLILSGGSGAVSGDGIELADESLVATTLRRIRWATPERLARERSSPERVALGKFLDDHGLGVLVSTEGRTFRTFVGVGVPASRAPYTYPQVTQLLELAAIIEGALERAHLSAKAQHAEQLATVGLMGASLAHEIRNPLVSIKTFVQLLPDHYHDAAFREKFFHLIGDEVGRIDRLTGQLLDMAVPRNYAAELQDLHPVLESGLELVLKRAEDKGVELRRDLQANPSLALIDPAAVKQVLLNLCFNAIQAVEPQKGERWLRVATRNTKDSIELIISDSGPGIPEHLRPRLFQPFQTTKSSGFGLGLAICRDILGNLNAVITVDQAAPGQGATFRVFFPCRPS